MLHRSAVALLAGAAILAAIPCAARAQDTTTKKDTTHATHMRTRHARTHSQVRIPVSKNQAASAGEVTQPVARVDTVQLPGRVDTVTVTNTVTKTDTLTVTKTDTLMEPVRLHEVGPFYIGADAGASLPAPNFSDPNTPGWRFDGMLGVDPQGSPLGLRVLGGYSQYTTHDWASSLPSAKMMNADIDAKLRLLSLAPPSTTIKVYALGGVTFARFKDVLENGSSGYQVGNSVGGTNIPSSDEAWHSGAGWNAGGGVEFQRGITSFFVESRFARIKGVASNISTVPLVVGLTFR